MASSNSDFAALLARLTYSANASPMTCNRNSRSCASRSLAHISHVRVASMSGCASEKLACLENDFRLGGSLALPSVQCRRLGITRLLGVSAGLGQDGGLLFVVVPHAITILSLTTLTRVDHAAPK